MASHLTAPYGGSLVNLQLEPDKAEKLKQQSRDWASWNLTRRQICDLELLSNGAFSPLTGFMGQADYDSVCKNETLANGTYWPVPITLDVPEETAKKLKVGDTLTLRDMEGVMPAVIQVSDIWQPDLKAEAKHLYGTTDEKDPAVSRLMNQTNPYYIGGELLSIQPVHHYDFVELRLSPAKLREKFASMGSRRIVSFQSQDIIHRSEYELTSRIMKLLKANLLIQPLVGLPEAGDIHHYTRIRCCQEIIRHYPRNSTVLGILPLIQRQGAGSKQVLLAAIAAKNFGCTHTIAQPENRDDCSDKNSHWFDDAQHKAEKIGIELVPFEKMLYLERQDRFVTKEQAPEDLQALTISHRDLQERLDWGKEVPAWSSFPEVVKELRRAYPPRSKQGFTVFFSGLPSSGKSTLANVLMVKLLEIGGRRVTLLDGDIVRRNLSSELGFSKEHRDINIRRIGFVASQITKNGGTAICAPIAPYNRIREQVREMIAAGGGFVLVHVATPLEVCEQRDRKGLFAKARAGVIKEFTGISDPYEIPHDAELTIDTTQISSEEAVQDVILYLEEQGYIGPEA